MNTHLYYDYGVEEGEHYTYKGICYQFNPDDYSYESNDLKAAKQGIINMIQQEIEHKSNPRTVYNIQENSLNVRPRTPTEENNYINHLETELDRMTSYYNGSNEHVYRLEGEKEKLQEKIDEFEENLIKFRQFLGYIISL